MWVHAWKWSYPRVYSMTSVAHILHNTDWLTNTHLPHFLCNHPKSNSSQSVTVWGSRKLAMSGEPSFGVDFTAAQCMFALKLIYSPDKVGCGVAFLGLLYWEAVVKKLLHGNDHNKLRTSKLSPASRRTWKCTASLSGSETTSNHAWLARTNQKKRASQGLSSDERLVVVLLQWNFLSIVPERKGPRLTQTGCHWVGSMHGAKIDA